MLDFAAHLIGTTLTSSIQPSDIMSPGGNPEAYVQIVNSIPVLSVEREEQLAKALFEDCDLDAARQLVLAHLRFVAYVARSFSGYGLCEVDLIQEGNVGLMKAVKRFNPSFKVRLVSFAIYWIKAEIHEFILKNWRIVKVATTKSQRKLFFNLRSKKTTLGWMNEQEISDIAKALGVESVAVRQMEGRLSFKDEAYDCSTSDEETVSSPSQFLKLSRDDPSTRVEQQDWKVFEYCQLMSAYEGLDARSKKIISSRWLASKKLTLSELAKQFNISAERVRQLEQNALRNLREKIATQ